MDSSEEATEKKHVVIMAVTGVGPTCPVGSRTDLGYILMSWKKSSTRRRSSILERRCHGSQRCYRNFKPKKRRSQ